MTADDVSSAVVVGLGVVFQGLGLGGVAPEVVFCDAGAVLPFAVLVLFAALIRYRVGRLPIAVGASLSRGGVPAIRRFV